MAGTTFEATSPAVVGEKAVAGCAVAGWQRGLHLAWTGRDLRPNVAALADGGAVTGKRTLRHRSATTERTSSYSQSTGRSESSSRTVPLAPALAATASGLHLAWTGTDGRLNLWRLGVGEGGHGVLAHRSGTGPSLGPWGGGLALAWAGTDRRLNVAGVDAASGAAGSPLTLDERTIAAPAACGAGHDLVVAWAGTDRHLNVAWVSGGRVMAQSRLDERSDAAPALCPLAGADVDGSDGVVLAWTGGDRRVNAVGLGRWGVLGPSVRLDARSSAGPALTAAGGPVVAWTGSDGRPNVSRLVPVRQ